MEKDQTEITTKERGQAGPAPSYRTTLFACYVGYIAQAVNVNLFAVIFIPLRERFGLSYTQFGTLVFANFLAQLTIDIALSRAVDRFGTRPFIKPALGFCAGGLLLFALTPTLLPDHIFAGFMASTLAFAAAGGLLELCLSPIVEAIPSDSADSSKALSFLHSFYAWGQAGVVLITSALLFLGLPWQAIVAMWALIPAADLFLFARAPIAERAHEGGALTIRKLLKNRLFLIAVVAIAFGGASEAVVAQYASSYLQKGLGLPKLAGDLFGVCGFAVCLGLGRLLYGMFGHRLDIHKVLTGGSALAFAAYLVVVFSPAGAPPVAAIALCGLFVSLLWPGTLAVAAQKLPLAGASMFALLAAAGDLGCSIGPWAAGVATDFSMRFLPSGIGLNAEQFGLRAGLLVGALFPLASFVAQLFFKNRQT
ncbi:MAG: MFS transporter [Clostridiales bacterium]|jgi:fucose permease|nr:MFS transporter [Clostridiales bacterium]